MDQEFEKKHESDDETPKQHSPEYIVWGVSLLFSNFSSTLLWILAGYGHSSKRVFQQIRSWPTTDTQQYHKSSDSLQNIFINASHAYQTEVQETQFFETFSFKVLLAFGFYYT